MRNYLSKRYSAYAQNDKAKPFTSVHVQEELLCSVNLATLHIKEVLGKNHSALTFDQSGRVVCTVLDLGRGG